MLLPQEIIRKKRDGGELSAEEIAFFARGLGDGSIGEGQVAAFAMAVLFRGMTAAECATLTREMTGTGEVLRWSLPGPALDKHSTGGVGDKVSLMLAPIVAACGGYVPMIAGRGLGHTGGTIDKLDSIPGYNSRPGIPQFQRIVADTGCAIIGQTDALAPADRRLYAIRDVTATVESIPLLTTSILSKKLAAGLEGLVMDVKLGSGAFLPDREAAAELARSLVATAKGAGLPIAALLTDMNAVLGTTAGNALEVAEAIDYLTGTSRDPRLHVVTIALAAELLVLGRLALDPRSATARAEQVLASGKAAEHFARMVAALGGPKDLVEAPSRHLPAATTVVSAPPSRAGYVAAIDVRQVGLVVLALGGGRRRPDDAIDPAVGLTQIAAIGERVGPERPLALIHARSSVAADTAHKALLAAFQVGDAPPAPGPVVWAHVKG
jgi:thymidine phosphorylase